MSILKGSCLCGSVKYEAKGKPQLSFLCQCRQCQKITGSGHSAEFVVSEQTVSLSGELKSFDMKSEQGNTVSSLFCPTCGNPILKNPQAIPAWFSSMPQLWKNRNCSNLKKFSGVPAVCLGINIIPSWKRW